MAVAKRNEGHVKSDCKKVLKALPACSFFMPVQNGMGEAGIPDMLLCIAGDYWGVELKAPGKPTTPWDVMDASNRFEDTCVSANQTRKLKEIRDAGGIAYVVDDVEQLIEALKVHGHME